MNNRENYFWQNFKNFSDHLSLIDTTANKSLTYRVLDVESEKLSSKIKLAGKRLVFLFTTNNLESVIA